MIGRAQCDSEAADQLWLGFHGVMWRQRQRAAQTSELHSTAEGQAASEETLF